MHVLWVAVECPGWKGTKWTANGPSATGTREGSIGRSRVSTSCWLHWASSCPWNIGITHTGPPFDLEACLVPVSEGTFISQHVPMSVSLASNVPSYEDPYNFISDGCPQRLVDDMMSCLWDMSDATYCLMREAMDPYSSQLDDLSFRHGKEMECTWDLEEAETEAGHILSSSTGAHALTKAR